MKFENKFNCTISGSYNQLNKEIKMISSMSLEDARQAINEMSQGFETLVNICRSLDKSEQRRLFSPDTFGPISQFLCLGNGYEPAFPGPQYVSSERLLEILEDNVIYDDEEDLTEDLTNEDEFADYDIPGNIPREV